MTSEQLDEIENLRLAATGGNWQHQRWPCQVWEGEGSEGELCAAIGPLYAKAEQPNREQVYADAKFMEAMSVYAVPLVNALREALAQKLAAEQRFDMMEAEYLKACKQRDDARAEVEHLRKILNPAPKPDLSDILLRQMKAEQRREIYRQAWEAAILEGKERNEAHRIAAEAADAVVSLEEI